MRLRLLSVVASHTGGEACVCDLSVGIELSQPTISHHLKVLRTAGLLDSERRGSWVYYRVIPEALQQLSQLLGTDTAVSSRMNPVPMARRLLAEFTGTALLVTVVVGSGIAAQQLSPNDVGLQLLENSTATVFGLAVLILMFGPVSGAHFNPVVSAADWLLGRRAGTGISGSHVVSYTVAQITGGIVGAVLANVMFDLPGIRDRHQRPHHHGPSDRGSGRHRRPDRADLRPGPHRPRGTLGRGGRRLHRCRVLVHQLHLVRQPGRHHRPDLLRHLRRYRPDVGARLHRRPDRRRADRARP